MLDNTQQSPKKIVLIGMPGCGKTTVSETLANRLGWPWFDSDQEIEKQKGIPITEIFSRFGEPYFRELEAQCLKELLLNRQESAVISLGGGAVGSLAESVEGNPSSLLSDSRQQNCLFVYLHRSITDILKSVDLKDRPLLKDNPERIKELFRERHPLYQQISHIYIENNGSIDQAADKIWQAVVSSCNPK